MSLLAKLKGRISNIHSPGDEPDIFIFTVPRSGSTFLIDLLFACRGMKTYNEPLNPNYPVVRRELGIDTWAEATTLKNRRKVYERYFRRLISNQIPELNTPIYRPRSRLFTHRVSLKLLHGGEDLAGWFEETFAAKILILIRHPIPTAFSHKQFQRLPHFLKLDELRAQFTEEQIAIIERVNASGSHLKKGVVSWCVQLRPLLGINRRESWTVVSYEDLTMFPIESARFLEERLQLNEIEQLDRVIAHPSESTISSDPKTREFFEREHDRNDREFLISKWQDRATQEEIKTTFDLLAAFEIDCYEPDNLYPSDRYRVPGILAPT